MGPHSHVINVGKYKIFYDIKGTPGILILEKANTGYHNLIIAYCFGKSYGATIVSYYCCIQSLDLIKFIYLSGSNGWIQ